MAERAFTKPPSPTRRGGVPKLCFALLATGRELAASLASCESHLSNSQASDVEEPSFSQPSRFAVASLFFTIRIPYLRSACSVQYLPGLIGGECITAVGFLLNRCRRGLDLAPRLLGKILRRDEDIVHGCDGSVLLDDTANFTGEKTAFPNKNSLRGFDVIDSIKSQVEAVCTQIVSCADILAVAARDSVVALGGPSWTVKLGRRDSTTASLSTANSDLPGPNLDLSALITAFSNKGLSTTDLIALSGAHTIGQARCVTFRNRIYNETNIDSSYASSLQANCPSVGGDDNFSDLDVQTPTTFDNNYYVNLVNNKGLLHSDQQLFNGGSTDSQVKSYTTNSDQFSTDFAAAIINMGDLNPLTGTQGEIRISCRKIN
ncbi:cationic peroxidase 1 [Dendrobium catenatum]|uniref:cationic peroxidase 1 n=1 Tax=Dendrobium catenatum TaxID=906689 RepID=UPI00109EF689|nr:cationic peroxidase 1 [Dendrobium catenatum]